MSAKKSDSFEENLARLQQIVEHLENGDVPLDEALKLYEEGIGLSKRCSDKLNQAEIVLKRLAKDMEGHLKLFEEDASDE